LEEGTLAGMPVLLAATGGTPRHSMVLDTALRPLFSHLKALTAPTAVYAAAEDWGSPGLDARIERAGRELADLVMALPSRRRSDPFDSDDPGFVSFEEMLGRCPPPTTCATGRRCAATRGAPTSRRPRC